jgi:hypothetical protein
MPERHLPVRPNLEQLKHQAKDLLAAIRAGDAEALADLQQFHPEHIAPGEAKLADAQLVLARSYQVPSWPRLVLACRVIDAIWRDDVEALRALVTKNPALIHEQALARPKSNWGAPMSYAANLGRDKMIEMLRDLGATDFEHALHRAVLQGQVATARMLHRMAGEPPLPRDILSNLTYTLSVEGAKVCFELGAKVYDAEGKNISFADVVLETDSRKPEEKHAILEMLAQHGFQFPDTPTMALHRGRIDLLEEHLRRDPNLLRRTFTMAEIYPAELNCQGAHQPEMATHGTPLEGATLLHMCADYDELEIAKWLLDRGMDPNARAAVDADGFGGHTALFATVVSQPAFWINHNRREPSAQFTQLLLDRGADPNIRASLRKKLHPGYGEDFLREYRDVTALSWGECYAHKKFVNAEAMRLIAERGGQT